MHIISFLTSSFAFRAQLTLFQALTTQLQKRQRCLPSNSSPLTSHFRAGLVFKRVHLLEICMKGVYWKVGIEQECKLQKNRQHIHISTQREKKRSFRSSSFFCLSHIFSLYSDHVLLEEASVWPWATPSFLLPEETFNLSLPPSLCPWLWLSHTFVRCYLWVLYAYSTCWCWRVWAKAAARERNERQKRKEYIEEDAGSYRKFVDV